MCIRTGLPMLMLLAMAAAPAAASEIDLTNENFQRSAERFCRRQQSCTDDQWNAYSAIKEVYESGSSKKKLKIEQAISNNTIDSAVNWTGVAIVTPGLPSDRARITYDGGWSSTSCSASVSKNGRHVSSTCWSN